MRLMTNLQLTDDPAQVRREQLRRWIKDHFKNEQVQFIADCASRDYHLNQGELSGLLKQKSFGEKKARALEVAAGMPHRYLDTHPRHAVTGANVVNMEVAPYKVKRYDKWTQEAIDILSTMTKEQKAACVVNLRAYRAAIGPLQVGQAL